jgi:hypothetical protein
VRKLPAHEVGGTFGALLRAERLGRRTTLEEQQKPDTSSRIITRRTFLQGTAASAAGLVFAPGILRAAEVNQQKLRIAYIGTGGRADAHLGLANHETCVAYCDVDTKHWGKIKGMAPTAKGYTDWREMYDKHLKDIDAVIVTTPDHSHALPSLRAMREGQARLLREAAHVEHPRSAPDGRNRGEQKSRNADGQSGPRQPGQSPGRGVGPQRGYRRCAGSAHLDQSSRLAAGQPDARAGSGAGEPELGRVDWPGAVSRAPQAPARIRLARLVRLRLRRRG